MTPVSSRPVARLTSPGDIVATVPTLCGFLPQNSVVVLSLRGPRKRLGLTVRLDLPPPGQVALVGEALADRVAQDGGGAAAVVVFAARRAPVLVDAVTAACAARSIDVTEALHVADARWSSYACTGPCCPVEGTAVPPVPGLVEAEQALDGRAVLASREELVRSLAPPAGPLAALATARLESAGQRWLAERQSAGVASARRSAVLGAEDALQVVAGGGTLANDVAAEFAIALHDVLVRDEVATWALERSDALLSLAEQIAGVVVPPHDAPVCTLLAWVAYARGDGARANVALDRALLTDPAYSLALLLRQALDGAVAPAQVRRSMRATRRALRPGRRAE